MKVLTNFDRAIAQELAGNGKLEKLSFKVWILHLLRFVFLGMRQWGLGTSLSSFSFQNGRGREKLLVLILKALGFCAIGWWRV